MTRTVSPRPTWWAALAMLCACGALRQSYRVRRVLRELTPPEEGSLPAPPPRVAVVLPVRNEEANLDGVLASLVAQDYPALALAVVDDASTDATPARLAAWAAREPRLRAHRVAALPPGWAGKAHALHIGVGLTAGEWLLFTDADTRHDPRALRRMVGHAERHGIALLSLFTRFSLIGPGMRLLTPIGALIALERATPAELRDPGHRAALANGQYILIRRDIYEATGGYAAPGLRDTFADDVHLARLVKEHGGRVAMVDGRALVTNEQWKTWGAVWGGWRKSAYGELAPRPLFGLVTGLALLGYGVAPVAALLRAALARRPLPALLAAATVAAQIDARRFFDREFGLPLRWSLTAPAGWAAFGLLVLDTVRLALAGRGADWKGRAAPTAQDTAPGPREAAAPAAAREEAEEPELSPVGR